MIMYKKILFPLMALLISFGAMGCSGDGDQETTIKFGQLPQQARQFVISYFSTYEVASVQSEGIPSKPYKYEVDFANGTEIDFDAAGSWTKIDCGLGFTVPAELVPLNISVYLQQLYPSASVVEIERNAAGYKVGLSNDVEGVFDVDGNFLYWD